MHSLMYLQNTKHKQTYNYNTSCTKCNLVPIFYNNSLLHITLNVVFLQSLKRTFEVSISNVHTVFGEFSPPPCPKVVEKASNAHFYVRNIQSLKDCITHVHYVFCGKSA